MTDREIEPEASFDVLVIGGGMVGSAAACALAAQGRKVALIESRPPQPFERQQPIDLRVSAISPASQALLTALGAWAEIRGMRLCPYKELHTWEQDNTKLQFSADELGRDVLGHIIENRVIQLALWQACQQAGVVMFDSQSWQYQQTDQGVRLSWEGGVIHASLLIGADGAHSQVRHMAGIGIQGWDYAQHCLSVNVRMESPQQQITWQKFFPSGPRALLPLPDRQAALVWYDAPQTIAQLSKLPPEELKRAIVDAFPPLPGDIHIQNHASFPLTRRHANRYVQGRVALVGDAAHTINPLAGQGVNLGFKDVQVLADCLSGVDEPEQLLKALERYQRRRRPDNLLMQSAMDAFYLTFSNQQPVVKSLRNLGLTVAQHSGPIKREVLRYALGLAPKIGFS